MTGSRYEGVTLAGRLTQGPIEPQKALDILEQVLEDLAVAHDAGAVHGAISPEKVILTPDGRATLTGFPAADAGAQLLVRPAQAAVNPAYIAPEQIMDDPVGRRADIYAVGVMAYAMLTGKDPFGVSDGVATDNVFYRILYRPTPHVPDAVLVGLPEGVGPAIERAMAKEPQGRFQDARSFLAALESETAVVAAAAAPVEKGPRPKWMLYALTGGAAVIVLLAIGLGVAYGLGGKTPATTVAEDTTASVSTIPSTTTLPAVVDDSTTAAPSSTDTLPSTMIIDTSSTTTTTLPPSSTTLSTVTSTTTTKRTTTTVKPTTTTTKRTTTTVKPTTTTTVKPTTTTTVIVKKKATITVVQRVFAYDGAPHHLIITAAGEGGVDLTSLVDPGASETEIGDYTITWSFAGNANYESDSRAAILSIQ